VVTTMGNLPSRKDVCKAWDAEEQQTNIVVAGEMGKRDGVVTFAQPAIRTICNIISVRYNARADGRQKRS
jgi:hypothetical protein